MSKTRFILQWNHRTNPAVSIMAAIAPKIGHGLGLTM